LFRGPVRVPDEAGQGKARVTLSFADWKEAKVASVRLEVPVMNATPATNKK
jgi:hypothetical protein